LSWQAAYPTEEINRQLMDDGVSFNPSEQAWKRNEHEAMRTNGAVLRRAGEGGGMRGFAVQAPLVAVLLAATSFGAVPAHGQEPGAARVDTAIATDTLASPADRARAMMRSLDAVGDSIEALEATRLTDPDVDNAFIRVLALEQVGQGQRTLRSLSHLMDQVGPESLPADSIREFVSDFTNTYLDLLDHLRESVIQDFEVLRRQRSSATATEIGSLESQIREVRARGDTLLRYQEWALNTADSLQFDVADRWASYDELLVTLAESATGRLQIAVAERDELRDRIRVAERSEAPESELANLRLILAAVETRIEAIAGNMVTATDQMERRGFETSAYEEALIRSTGEVTGDVLDPQVFIRLVRGAAEDTGQYLRRNSGTVLVRFLIVITFIVVFRVLFSLLWRLFGAIGLVRTSRLVRDLLGRLVRPAATLVGLLAGLAVIGVHTNTLLAGLGIAGLVVGLALQDSLSNLFAGIAILASNAFDVDDVVEVAGVVGKIRSLGLWNTTIVTFDGRRLLIPNRKIWGANLENRSVEPTRRADAVARIGYDADLKAAIAALEEMLRDDARVLEDPAPRVWVSRLDESWAEVKLWPWTRTEDWWSLYSDLPQMVRLKLAEVGIGVPVPRRDVTMRSAESTGGVSESDG